MIYIAGILFVIGIFLGIFISKVFGRKTSYSGAIVVTKNDGRTLYSLELEDFPEKIQFKKKVVFKVVVPDESHRE